MLIILYTAHPKKWLQHTIKLESSYFCCVKQTLFIAFYFICAISTIAQNQINQAKWQQKVDYDIKVRLFPTNKILKATIAITYTNNSPDTLKSIWLHIWPNAYKNNQTAFAKQLLSANKTDFQFCKPQEKGWIDSFNFTCNKHPLNWHYDEFNIDIIEVILEEALLPNSSIVIETPFVEKLPALFSRGGYKNNFFAVTQWYPKPATYDVNGWNKMPYLDQGEFYSEFGNFKVSITAPEKYLIAASGNLQTQSEINKLNNIFTEHKGHFVSQSNVLRTVEYEEKNIHDFAWFADTCFRVVKSFVKLPNNDTVTTWMFIGKNNHFDLAKKNPTTPLDEAILEYSKKIGNYPYKQCTVVIGDLLAGGGMEYPTITVCQSLDYETIRHEVGHNWFYGMLGTNERKYPWMDESINTFFEQQLSDQLRGNQSFFEDFKSKEWTGNYETLLAYLFSARQGIAQPLNTPSDSFSNLNYGAIVYAKGPLLFAYLQQQLGDSLFYTCFQNYFREWQYKHPLPGDMQRSFENTLGKSMEWFFKDLLMDKNNIDLVKKQHQYQLKGSEKLDAFLKEKKYLDANPYGFLPEKNYLNNGQKKHLISIGIPLRLPQQNTSIPLNLTPIIGYNLYDQFYAGALVYNRSIFRKKVEYFAMPAYAFGSKKLVGYAKLNFLFISQSKNIYKTETGLQGQSFGMQYLTHANQYFKINPYLKIFFKHKGKIDERFDQQLQVNLYRVGLQNSAYKYDDTTSILFPNSYFNNYCRVTYSYEDKHPINHFSLKLNSEIGSGYKTSTATNTYIKTWLNTEYKYQYARKKYLKSSFFAGVFIYKNGLVGNNKFFLSGNNGKTDYLYNEVMLGRSESIFSNNILGHQIINNNGNMRNVISFLDGTSTWMLSSSNEASLPGIIPFRIYADFGFYPYKNLNASVTKPQLFTTAGITLPLFKETLEIFVPIFQSKQFLAFNLFNYSIANSIGFKLNLNKLEPFKLIDNFRP